MSWTEDFVNTPIRVETKHKAKSGPAKKLRADTIKAIQGLAYLGSRPCVVPVYTGVAEHDGKRYALGRLGSADLICTFFGRAIHLELKAGRDQQSERQKKFAERVAQAGGIYVIVHEPADAVDALMQIAAARPNKP